MLARVSRDLQGQRGLSWSSYAAAAAVLFALWANFSWTAGRTAVHQFAPPYRDATPELTVRLQQLLPELSSEEAEQQARCLQLSAGLPDTDGARCAVVLGIHHF